MEVCMHLEFFMGAQVFIFWLKFVLWELREWIALYSQYCGFLQSILELSLIFLTELWSMQLMN